MTPAAPSLAQRLRSHTFTVTSELVPPRSADAGAVRNAVAELGFADGINVTDLPQARTRMSALAAAAIAAAAGARPILQMTCRDRNRLGLAADAIGAAAVGVEAILPLWGDHVPEGVAAAEVRDVDAAGLIDLLRHLCQGITPDGQQLDAPLDLVIGSAASPGFTKVSGLLAKVESGATFVQTQIVLDVDAFVDWLDEIRDAGLADRAAILPGIAIPRSAAMVERMRGFGAKVADDVAERADAGEGEELARELVERLVGLPGVCGVHLMPLGSPPEALAALAQHARAAATARSL